MHNNYYFLRQLSAALEGRLAGSVLSECFSQNKDELMLRFETATGTFYIRASLLPGVGSLSFPTDFQRARKNSVDLFPSLLGHRVEGIRQFRNERSFSIRFSAHKTLLFKMHGTRTNLILFEGDRPTTLFRNRISADLALDPDTLDREIDWSREYFSAHVDNLSRIYFTFGKVVWQYLRERGFDDAGEQEKWSLLTEVRSLLEQPVYYIIRIHGEVVLSLLSTGDVLRTWQDPLQAANDFYHTHTREHAFSTLQRTLHQLVKSRLDNARSYYEKKSARLAVLMDDSHYRMWADLIMANLHAIPQRAERVELPNFYHGNRPEMIKLNKELSPQKNAEVYYRKAKNQHQETDRIRKVLGEKDKVFAALEEALIRVETAPDLKALRNLQGEFGPDRGEEKKQDATLPYHAFSYRGFAVWVGKNAKHNDTLTLQHGYKDDLWLHAKDVAGSHVLLKHQAGKPFPRDVIEHAASLAAFYSKRKHEALCPVIVTPKKFVRKRKGDPPGAVVVAREEVLMVTPMPGAAAPDA